MIKGITKEKEDAILDLLNKGVPQKQISEMLRTSGSTIMKVKKDNGITVRRVEHEDKTDRCFEEYFRHEWEIARKQFWNVKWVRIKGRNVRVLGKRSQCGA